MMKKSILILVFLLFSEFVFAQEEPNFMKKNNIQIELGGHGFFYSINYERLLYNSTKIKIAGLTGFSYYPPSVTGSIEFAFPVLLNTIIVIKGNHHLECGLGIVVRQDVYRYENTKNILDDEWSRLISGRFGYRYQRPNGNLVFRVGFTPFYVPNYSYIPKGFYPSGGISIGYAFGR